ncbi:MAG: TonB-dependent receptor [[Candidatus Thermochlorobacteriaceae] bacterium GBChlB]|nr:MAG: TonB-dependent receptor [[Candidatus Thermochlorobacteriaceae] bacterium GBChlB]
MKYLLIYLLLSTPAVLSAQIITVKDRETGQALELARLISQSPKAFATTNKNGQVDIAAFKGSEKIEIRLVGYRRLEKRYDDLAGENSVVYLSPSQVSSDEIVVSATRWTQAKRTVPHKITTLTPKDITLLNPQTAADMLGASGDVFIQKSQQGGGSPMIRGFSTNRLLYAVDGVRMNNAIFRGGNLQQVISLDAFAIENTEIFFGAGSVIYGSDAIGGVMNFQTLTPQFSLFDEPFVTAKGTARFSSANEEQTGNFQLNIGWKNFALLTNLTYSSFGSPRMGRNGRNEYLRPFFVQRIDSLDRVITNPDPLVQRPNDYQQINLMQKVRYTLSDTWELQYGFHFSETSEYARYDRLIETAPNGLPRSAVWNYGPQKWTMHTLSGTHKGENALYDLATLRLAYQYFQESRIDRNFSGGQRFRLRTQLEEVRANSLNLDFTRSFGGHQIFYGAEAVLNNVASIGSAIDIRSNNSINVADRYPQSDWASLAAYMNYQFQSSENFLVQAGARYNYFTINADFARNLDVFPFSFTSAEVRSGALTGNLGAVFTPDDSWTVSATLSTGFRAPNVDDIGKIFDQPQNVVVVPNPTLSAEYAYNGELAVSKIFGDVARVELTGYYTYLDRALVRRDFQFNGQDSILYDGILSRVQAIQNAAFADVYGVQASIDVKLPLGFGLSSRFNYQIGNEELDDGTRSRSRHAAPWFGVTRLTYTTRKLDVQLYAMYSGEVSFENLNVEERGKPQIYAIDDNGNPFSPSWLTLNFKALYRFEENFTITAGVENLTDIRYRPYSSGLVALGRNFVIALRAGL